ncbi:MAG: pantoate--beta-alanine ligase [Lysobacterales bacterium]
MIELKTLKALRSQRACWASKEVALVPTMGNLHEGHLSLIDLAKTVADCTVASIFVNPTQFGPGEDFAAYPRTLEADLAQLKARGCDAVLLPDEKELYPFGLDAFTTVEVPLVGEGLCDARRPGHFRGVTSVVSRLFNAVQPEHAIFGQKDFQQLQTIRRMTAEMAYGVQIHAAPIAREPSGLAMSSRNGYLTAEQKQQASTLQQSLQGLAMSLRKAPADWPRARARALKTLEDAGLRPEYLELRDANTLSASTGNDVGNWVILIAATLGSTRLIDNLRL